MNESRTVMENLGKATFDALGYLKKTYSKGSVVYFSPRMYDAFVHRPTVHHLYKDRDKIKTVLSLLPEGCMDIPKGDCFLYAGVWFCRSEQQPVFDWLD